MSEIKFAAAKELIQEKKYDEARAILKTINDPKAERWLTRLDEIAPTRRTSRSDRPVRQKPPAPPSQTISREAEEFYRAQNKRRRRRKLGNGIELTVMGIFAVGASIVLSSPTTVSGVTYPSSGGAWGGILFLGGVATIIIGLIAIARRNKV